MRSSGRQNRNAARRIFRAMGTALLAAFLIFPPASFAHPMGNFSISHYSGLTINGRLVELSYFIDMAEIPTFQELQGNEISVNGSDPRLRAYLAAKAEKLAGGLRLTLNGRALSLNTVSEDVIFPPGAGNLPTMKFGFVYQAEIVDDCSASCRLEFLDGNFPDRAGWKEMVVRAENGAALLSSSAPSQDRSGQLSNYPTDLLNSPPQQLQASVVFSADGPRNPASSSNASVGEIAGPNPLHGHPAAGKKTEIINAVPPRSATQAVVPNKIELKANQQGTPRNSFTELIATKQITFGFAILAALIAAGLGALHALEPGHGKTIVAAYLVGAKGTARHALLLGTIVTASHTAGVYLLGAITLYAQKYILPDRIYPFLGVLSGILIAGMGCYLFLQRFLGEEFAHTHGHEISGAREAANEQTGLRSENISAKQLLLLGITGGIVPCPAALVVLLSAAALRRTGFGLFLIVAFSIGLAAVLITMGLAAVYAGRLMSGLRWESPLIKRWLPMASAITITLLGCGIALRGLMAAGIVPIHLWA